jgi:nucleoside-diphosphate-sugar epimerase
LRAKGARVRIRSRGTHPDEDGIAYVTGDLFRSDRLGRAAEGSPTVLHLAASSASTASTERPYRRRWARTDHFARFRDR